MSYKAALLVMVICLGAIGVHGDDSKQKKQSYWMKQKLVYSQNILSGLATEDFESIRKNASSMKALDVLETYVHPRSKDYRMQLQTFQFANDELIRNAREKNVDGAALAYVQLSVSCVNCHKLLRSTR